MRVVSRVAELRAAVAAARRDGRRVGLVPTMGALHEGHLSLLRRARADTGYVVVSIFVNPLQFGPEEDFDAYPRDLARDQSLLASLDAAAPDLVFAPPVEEVYPRPMATSVSVRELTTRLCGVDRPGHFDGVTTVVAKLFNLVQPDAAFFGRKDFQQLQAIRRMVADLDQPVEVVGCPTIREPDGLALSSRNAYLASDERVSARTLSRALRAAVLAGREARDTVAGIAPDVLRDAAIAILEGDPQVRIDYLEVVDPETLASPDRRSEARDPGADRSGEAVAGRSTPAGTLLVAVAAHVGRARLIDNVVVGDLEDEERLLAATADG